MDYLDNLCNETWKAIDGYEEYLVSNFGRVKSMKRNKEKILKPVKDKKRGYLHVCLSKNNKGCNFLIHRLVAQAFLDNCRNYPQVNHKDENKENNCIDNLEYCTNEYNVNYGTRKERISKKYGKPIIQLDLQGNFIKKWNGVRKAGRELGINTGNIWECCNNKRKTAKGYIWKYEDMEEIYYGRE